MLVHFPVALFPAALFFALLSQRRRPEWLAASRWLLFAGTLTLLVTAATGLSAQRLMAHGSGTVVAVHRTFMLFATALAVLLSFIVWTQRKDPGPRSRRTLAVGLAAVTAVILLGADRGALVALRFREGLSLGRSASSSPGPTGVTAGAAAPAGRVTNAPSGESALRPGDPERGRMLYSRFDCDGCHGPDRKLEAPGIPPGLEYAGSKLQPAWVAEYLLRPHRIRWVDEERRPLLRMPDFRLTAGEARDLSAWLDTRSDTTRFPEAAPALSDSDAAAGKTLVAQYGCRGCHVLAGEGNSVGPVLDGVGRRLRPGYLEVFLQDPHAVIPGTAMRNFHLWDDERRQLTAYLSSLKDSVRVSP